MHVDTELRCPCCRETMISLARSGSGVARCVACAGAWVDAPALDVASRRGFAPDVRAFLLEGTADDAAASNEPFRAQPRREAGARTCPLCDHALQPAALPGARVTVEECLAHGSFFPDGGARTWLQHLAIASIADHQRRVLVTQGSSNPSARKLVWFAWCAFAASLAMPAFAISETGERHVLFGFHASILAPLLVPDRPTIAPLVIANVIAIVLPVALFFGRRTTLVLACVLLAGVASAASVILTEEFRRDAEFGSYVWFGALVLATIGLFVRWRRWPAPVDG